MTKKKYYPDVNPNPNFPEMEERILEFWESDNVFQKSIDNREGAKDFIFYDGPPFANGLPHYGHLLTGYVKDLFARYQTMLGRKVERRFGWDCHGLPAEMGVEKEIGVSGRAAIMNFGIDKFNAQCRADVMKYASEWEKYVKRQARWVDFKNDYKTMDKSFMESVMWAFKQLYDKGLIYEAMRVMPYSWAAETPLSNFETRLDNSYRERADKAVTVAFELEEVPEPVELWYRNETPQPITKCKILAWTTTPWTLPSNLALAVGKEVKYCCLIKEDTCYIIANFASEQIAKDVKTDYEDSIGGPQLSGLDFIGLKYKPLFPYFANHPNSFKIIEGDFIEEGSGTGIVHIAPGFGEDDQRVAEANGIELVVPVDNSGKFIGPVMGGFGAGFGRGFQTSANGLKDLPDLSLRGRNVFEANDDIIKWLKNNGHLIKQEQIIHNYPHCWRTDQPLIYRAMPSWYVEVTKFKDRMVELNQGINWIPENVKDGLFGKWLENARDWSISRNRFWGAPIPIWRSKSGKLHCVGSIVELEKLSGKKVTDLHRPFIDEVTFEIDGEVYKRVEDVLDCWFESGSMPYASQWKDEGRRMNDEVNAHSSFIDYPSSFKFPADFIVEYTAQTRGWFYTMMVLSTALFDTAPFTNCICHGVVLGEPEKDPSTGKMVAQKLSKRKKNYPEPLELFDKYGSDALRWAMLASPIMRGQELTIDKDGKFVHDVIRLHIKPIWNAYNFFVLYANADGIEAKFNVESSNLMDRYILAKANEAVGKIKNALDNYHTPDAYEAVETFFEALNNWYIRRSKERFWKTEHDADKQSAYDTLYSVLHMMCRAAAPLLPLTLEEIYKTLSGEESVHLADFPSDQKLETKDLTKEMDKVRDACNAALSIRSAQNIRVRQPLSSMTIVGVDLSAYEEIIRDELNVKEIKFASDIAAFAEYKLKINFPILGKRLPEKMKQIIPAAKQNKWQRLANGHVEIIGEELLPEECELLLEPKDKTAAAPLASQDSLVVLDLKLTPELINEGFARDVVRMVQQARKEAGLNVADRIDLSIETSAGIIDFKDYIAEQVLAKSIKLGDASGQHVFENELDGKKIKIALSLVS